MNENKLKRRKRRKERQKRMKVKGTCGTNVSCGWSFKKDKDMKTVKKI